MHPDFLASFHAGTARARVVLHIDREIQAFTNIGYDMAGVAVIGHVSNCAFGADQLCALWCSCADLQFLWADGDGGFIACRFIASNFHIA